VFGAAVANVLSVDSDDSCTGTLCACLISQQLQCGTSSCCYLAGGWSVFSVAVANVLSVDGGDSCTCMLRACLISQPVTVISSTDKNSLPRYPRSTSVATGVDWFSCNIIKPAVNVGQQLGFHGLNSGVICTLSDGNPHGPIDSRGVAGDDSRVSLPPVPAGYCLSSLLQAVPAAWPPHLGRGH